MRAKSRLTGLTILTGLRGSSLRLIFPILTTKHGDPRQDNTRARANGTLVCSTFEQGDLSEFLAARTHARHTGLTIKTQACILHLHFADYTVRTLQDTARIEAFFMFLPFPPIAGKRKKPKVPTQDFGHDNIFLHDEGIFGS